MTSPIADGVVAATYKLVQQAMTGQWQEVPKTIAERQALLARLNASATPQDTQWLSALQQAMAESDAAVARMSEANRESGVGSREAAPALVIPNTVAPSADEAIDGMIDMIRGSR